MSTTPNLGLELVPSNSLQPSVPVNADMQLLDAVTQLVFQSMSVAAPPTTVAGDAGKCWLIPTAATGAWVGQTGNIALCTGADLWRFITPKVGWTATDLATDTFVRRRAAGTWS